MNLRAKFDTLPLPYKLGLGILLILLILFIFRMVINGSDSVHDWFFDRKIAQSEKRIQDLTNQYNSIKEENLKLKEDRMKLDAEVSIYKANEKRIPLEVRKEQEKLAITLEQLDKEKENIDSPASQYDRCTALNNRANFNYKLDCQIYTQ